MAERVSFNINAELYENSHGELAIRFPDERVYRDVGKEQGASFIADAKRVLTEKSHPGTWHEIPAHELLYGHGWHCISRMGFVEGDVEKPGVEFEVTPEEMGETARTYLKEVLH